MLQSLFTARLGLRAQQQRVDTIANNIANINTNGFKANSVRFKDALYATMQKPLQPQTDVDLELGTGVLVSSSVKDFSQGSPKETENPLDLCILGDGFFAVEDNDTIKYTRDGRFGLSLEGDDRYLVTAQDFYVLDDNLNRIIVPLGDEELSHEGLSIDIEGNMFMGLGDSFSRLNLVSFYNNDGLESVGDNAFIESELSGGPIAFEGEVKQGFLESSNVDLAREMTRLIRSQRSYSLASRAVMTVDEMQGTANNLR